jgi:hypothetical protein
MSDDVDDVPDAPSPVGQYPAEVWAAALGSARTARAATTSPPADLLRSLKEADYSDDITGAIPAGPSGEMPPSTELENETIYRIIREVAEADSGDAVYVATSADREFETSGHAAYKQRHFGLGFGILLATQESGRLGRVLELTRQRDPQGFANIFGSDTDALLATTNSPTSEQRLQPVMGEPLWSQRWIERFQRLGALPACQYAQNEEAIEDLFRPMLKVAASLGIVSDRGLAMMFDRIVTRGLGGGLRWVVQAAGPLGTETQRDHALQLLGYRDVRGFQAATPGLPQDGILGVETYAELVAALRRQGSGTLPSPSEYVCRMVSGASGPAQRRLLRLRDSAAFTDSIFHFQ